MSSVKAVGGETALVTHVDAHEGSHRFPTFLPDGRHFLYSIFGRQDVNGVYVGSLDGKTKKLLVPVSASAVYAPPGYVLFVDGDTLFGQAFNAERLELSGQPFLVAEHVGRSTAFLSAVSASRSGIIAYAGAITARPPTWIDRQNTVGSPDTPEGDYRSAVSDETRLAASLVDPGRRRNLDHGPRAGQCFARGDRRTRQRISAVVSGRRAAGVRSTRTTDIFRGAGGGRPIS
jgi:hypothetical protein